MSELSVAAKLRMVAKGVYKNGDAVLADRFARLADESDVERTNLTERVKELEEALRLQVIDSKKVIDNLCNTGCDEAWSIIKLNNMITDANDAIEKE